LWSIQSTQIGLTGEQVVAAGVEHCRFDVVVEVFEQEVIAALDEAKVEVVGCLDDIAICNGEAADGVLFC